MPSTCMPLFITFTCPSFSSCVTSVNSRVREVHVFAHRVPPLKIHILMNARSMSANMSRVEDSSPRQGWTSGPDGRGTLDIIWSCSITMFLCSWSILCLNVPGPKESRWQIFWRKLSLTILSILCPELTFSFAYGQWLQARQSVQDISEAAPGESSALEKQTKSQKMKRIFTCTESLSEGRGPRSWTMKEAFFAEMGGFRLRTMDFEAFPLDAKQIHYLVSNGHMDLPTLTGRVIEEKNKADGLLRAITLCQILWFLINVIGRWAQRLAVTTFELTTVSFILCSSMTAFFWWRKPADVFLPVDLDTDISISNILQAENQTLTAWNRTPLDFVNREEWWWSKCWSNFVNILRKMRLSFGSDVMPIDRIGDTQIKAVSRGQQWIIGLLAYIYLAVLFAGWEHDFLTSTEQTLWRAACGTMMGAVTALLIVLELTTFRNQHPIPTGFLPKFLGRVSRQQPGMQGLNRALNGIRNNSATKDPTFYIPLRILLPIYVIAVFYCHARTYVFVADFMELRSLPASAYATVNWQKFWPHFA